MIWGLIASCLLCNSSPPFEEWETGFRWETGIWTETGQDSGCDPWVALRDAQNQSLVALDFGEVQGAESRTLTLLNRIENCGTLRVTEVRVDGESFSIEMPTTPLVLEPQESIDLTVAFDPLQTGEALGSLMIMSNDPFYPELTIPLSGTLPALELSLDPTPLSFDQTLVPCESSAILTAENTGAEGLTLESVTLPEPFTLATELPLSLDSGASTSLDVRFAPLSEGVYGGTLSLNSEASTVSVELSASATFDEFVEEEGLATGERSFGLEAEPWEETLSVRVSGVRVDTWVYEPDDNSLLFDEDSTPDEGARLSIRYVPFAACQD